MSLSRKTTKPLRRSSTSKVRVGDRTIRLTPNQHRVLLNRGNPAKLKIACGAHACVFTDPRRSDVIVKITDDRVDVEALRRADHPRVARVYRTWKLKGRGRGYYALTVERVRPASPKLQRWADDFPIQLLAKAWDHKPKGAPDRYRLPEKLKQAAARETCRRSSDKSCSKFVRGIVDVHERLGRKGIGWWDLHRDNIGQRADGRWVLFDLGHGDASSHKKTKLRELAQALGEALVRRKARLK